MSDLVTSAESKRFIGVEHSDDDTLIGELITGVSAAVEKYTGRAFSPAVSYTEYLNGGSNYLITKRPPIKAITGVYDHFADDDEVDSDNYEFDANAGLIYYTAGAATSILTETTGLWGVGVRRWKIVYTVDYTAVPADVKIAVLTWIADIYAHRDDVKSGALGDESYLRAGAVSAQLMPDRVQSLLSAYKLVGF